MTNSWGNNGNNDRHHFLGLQNHLDSDSNHEIKRCLLLGRKAMTNLNSILKRRDITLLTKAVATHSSTLAWKIPWMEEPGRLQSMRSLRVGHDWATSLSLFTFVHWQADFLPLAAPGEGTGTPLQCSCLENPMGGGACGLQSMGSRRVRHDFTFAFLFHALEKEMAPHSSVLAWRIPGMGEPAGLPSMGSHRVGHDWSNLAAAEAVLH